MILFIDCYDSFSYNLIQLVSAACDGEAITVCHHDRLTREQLRSILPSVRGVVLGPGPGDPGKPEDRGVLPELWDLVLTEPVPVFGVCLGFQSMVRAFGGSVQRLKLPQHGQVAHLQHDGSAMFAGIPQNFAVVRYHSLCTRTAPPLQVSATALNDGIEMAAYHPHLPLWAVQFHPESVLSEHGSQLVSNFWRMAKDHNAAHRHIGHYTVPHSLAVTYEPLLKSSPASVFPHVVRSRRYAAWREVSTWLEDFVLLNSSAVPGKWSIFGVLEDGRTPHIRSKGDAVYEGMLRRAPDVETRGNVWEHVAAFMAPRLLPKAERERNTHNLPFLGGLVGYITYEGGCQHTVRGGNSMPSDANSDVSLVFIENAVLIKEDTEETFFVGSRDWTDQMEAKARTTPVTSTTPHISTATANKLPKLRKKRLSRPSAPEYESMVSACFEPLHAGDSYELCMTCQAELEFADPVPSPWELFCSLVSANPAPYCGYMAFDDCLVATSPERFMAWTDTHCEFRPIKGTVRKQPGMTLERATEILRTPKEQAENLMIVDLIRHDLGHLLHDVTCPQLMGVEEYASVYQLVTSVEAKFSEGSDVSGFDVLTQSLPPGSMTGAPKQRSVEILSRLETKPRGLYSGVQGYWSINDTGDWSVVIRSLFQYAQDPPAQWRLGAGGAVTVLSTAAGEYDEMCTKMGSVLRLFED